MRFTLNPVLSALLVSQALLLPVNRLWAATLIEFDPQLNDQQANKLQVGNATETLTGNARFKPGIDGAVQTTLGAVNIVSGAEVLNKPLLDPGPQNLGITVPDSTTGGNTIYQVYNSASLVAQAPVTESTSVPDVENVNGEQYINTRIADVTSGGTLNVAIGVESARSTAATNGWTMAAKQSALFNVDGTGASDATLNWNGNNRITFTGAAATPVGNEAQRTFQVQNVATFMGAFSVTTLDGKSNAFTVTDAASLQRYNNWLITQLQTGNLSTASYNTEFNKAFTRTNANIVYDVSATPPDEVTQAIGNRNVISAQGSGAKVHLAAGKTLEASGASGGAIRASDGADVVLDGKLASQGSTADGSALVLTGNSTGTNNGVINGAFLNRADGTGVGSTSFGAHGVDVQSGSQFNNTGILNMAATGSNDVNGVAGINLGTNASANNSGNINVGVNGSAARGTTSGVLLTDSTSQFTNNASGLIYIGRGPQNSKSETPADVSLNQSGLTSGIALMGGGSATNNGEIVIGTRTQNAAGMSANGGDATTMVNNGTITVNGAATRTPRENIGFSIFNSGSGGNINNAGTINLNGVNGTGVKVLASNGNQAAARSTGTINVAGSADPASGTRNFGVWVEGQGSGTASALVDGPVNLSGNGAIGVHARGNATVEVASDAIPRFSAGSNQIGFFAFGPNAKINVAGNTAFDVTTQGSTLFRLEQGADFDGTGLALTASGENAVGILGSGTGGTQINTQNARIDVTGKGATGLVIEGGANGVIDAATTMNLSGENAVAGIADGQKHTLSGANSGAASPATSLTSAAALTSAQNGLTGYIARNRAQLTNSGDINFSGANATGIRVETGATGTNTGNITINNGGSGLVVNSGTGTLTTTANNSGNINVNGGSTTARTRGVSATGARAVANLTGGSLSLNGVGAIGAQATQGATVNIANGATPVFNNSDQIAYHAAGAGSTINSATNSSNVNTARSSLYRIDEGAGLNFSAPTQITLSGTQTTGVIASGPNSVFNSGSSQFTLTGNGATAARVEGGARGTLSASSQFALNGANNVGVLVSNLRTDLSNALSGERAPTTVTSNANLSGSGAGAIGFDVTEGATLANSGEVSLSGANSIGIRSRNGSTLSNDGEVNIANGTGLDVSGTGTTLAKGGVINVNDGLAGVRTHAGASLALTGSDTIVTTGGSAHGILLDSGTTGLSAQDATINTNGTGSGIENRAEIRNVSLKNLTVNVANGSGIRTSVAFDPASIVTTNVSGSGIGLNITNADGSLTDTDLSLGSGYVFNVNGAGGTGIRANTTGVIDSAANVNINDAAGGSALVTRTASTVRNTGTLTSNSLTAPVVDLRGGKTRFENFGTIITAGPGVQAVAGSNADDNILLTEGEVVGDIAPGGGADRFQWTGGALNGSLTMGNDNNNQAIVQGVDLATTYHLTSGTGTGNTLTFADINWRGGSFAADDLRKGVNLGTGWSTINFNRTQWTLTDNLQLGHSTVNIDGDSTLYAGNGVNPTLSGGSANSLTVNNAGIIDLTNGSGSPGNTLTVAGSLASAGGSAKLVTTLNEGGALNNQFTDNLRVTGNASGTTLLDVTLSGASVGALSDLNHSASVEAYEGISLAQVAGNAQADSFALRDGYLAAGPWSYSLYSFAPGESDANQRRGHGQHLLGLSAGQYLRL